MKIALPRDLYESILVFSIAYVALLIFGVILLNLGIIPLSEWLKPWPQSDKVVHFFVLGSLAALLNLSLQGAAWRLNGIRIFKGSVFLAIIACSEECSQALWATRTFDMGDLAANVLGILCLGSIGIWWLERRLVYAEVEVVNS